MKKLMLFTLLSLCLYKAWQDFGPKPSLPPLYSEPYVAVYGRDSCGHTQKLLRELRQQGMEPHYLNVDDMNIADSLHARMEMQNIATQRYNLPVVDVNASLTIRPTLASVQD
ncbi:glutaredoxin domain-containing protein, partial [Shewanella sp. 6_MG-2023]|uniref:glutaredoxin domain-containing protein n=1 Tax=Shewanella sp. 6_MG-2023 TaxID=3062660 RepID=UPI0026E31110